MRKAVPTHARSVGPTTHTGKTREFRSVSSGILVTDSRSNDIRAADGSSEAAYTILSRGRRSLGPLELVGGFEEHRGNCPRLVTVEELVVAEDQCHPAEHGAVVELSASDGHC